MSKKLFSKIFVLLLVVGLLFAVAPTGQAQAATPVGTAAELGAALLTGETEITVTADISAGSVSGSAFVIPSGKIITLDLNGYDISAETSNGGVFSNAGTLTISDNSVDKGGMIINTNITQTTTGEAAKSAISNTGVLTVNAGVIVAGPAEGQGSWEDTNFNPAYGIDNLGGGKVTVNGATISGAYGLRNFANLPGTSITITDGIVTGKTGIAMQSFRTNDGTLTINGYTTITATTGSAIYAAGVTEYNQIVINGGTFSGPGDYGAVVVFDGTLDINGGTFTGIDGAYSLINYYAAVEVSAGTFNGDIYGGDIEGGGLTTFAPSVGEQIYFNGEISGNVVGAELVAPVHNVTQSTWYSTIQGAIDATSTVAGDVIEVADGTYNYDTEGQPVDAGLIKITKPVTLKAADDGNGIRPVINASGEGELTNDGVFKIHATQFQDGLVVIEGFDITGIPQTGIAITAAMYQVPGHENTIIIRDNLIHGMIGAIDFWGTTSFVTAPADPANAVVSHVEITGNKIYDMGVAGAAEGLGVMIEDPKSNVDPTIYAAKITNNEFYDFVAKDVVTPSAGIVIPRADAANGEDLDVLIQDNKFGTGVNVNVGIQAGAAITGPVIVENDFSNSGVGVYSTIPETVMASPNWWGSPYGPSGDQIYGDVDYSPWCADAACETFAPDAGGNVELSGTINVPGGILLGTPGLTYHLAADTVIQNDSPCFVITASNTRILAEPGAKCIPTGESNGIDVAADLTNITIDGLEIDGSVQTSGTADGIHFAGAVSDFVIVDNKIHNMLGDGIEFVGAPTGVVGIAGNLFQNNAGLGINAGTFDVVAQYNSWGSYAGPVVGTDITSGVNATPFTHADVTLSPIYETTNRVVTSLANVSGRPTVLKDGTLYHLWYGPTDTTLYHSVSTNPAEFPEGTLVTFSGATPFEVSSTAIFKEGETFYMVAYFEESTSTTKAQKFGLYSSTDGTAWTFVGQIFDATTPLMDDLGKIDAPFVLNDGTEYKLYFQKKSALGNRYDIYLASSTTVDGSYTLNATDPVLSPTEGAWDGKFIMHPWVVKDVDTYYMWYSAYDTGIPQEIGLATSTDGIIWTKSAANPVIGPTGEPTVIKDGDTWRIWYLSGATIKYQTAISPLELRQTLAYQVTANLVNVNAADVTISYPTDLLTIAELTSGTEIPGTFDTSVAGQINYVGAKLDKTTTTGEDVVLFNAIFLNKLLGSGDIAFGLAEFGMPGAPDLSSNNVYLAAAADTAEVEIKELPFLTTDLDSAYYLTDEPKTFTVTITNYGTAYTGAVLNLTLPADVTVTGVPSTINLAVGESQTLTLTFTSTTSGEKTIGFDLEDSLGALLFSTVETATVYDRPTISSDDIDGYYLTTVEQEFSVTLDNPLTGGDYAGVQVDLKITGADLADITSLYYWETALEPDGWAPWTLTEDVEGNLVGTFGPATTGFPMTPDYLATTPFKVTFANAGDYQVDLSLRDVDTGTILATFTDTAVVYTAPVITADFPTGPYVAGEEVIVPISITNLSSIPGPFSLVLNLPDGTVFTFNGVDYLCGDDPATAEVEVGCPAIPVASLPIDPASNLVITFDEGWTGDISMSLYDTSWEPDDRLLATFTEEGVNVLGAFDVNGTVSMQGRSTREGVQLILTGDPGTYDAFSSTLISNNYVIEDVAEGIYTFTTYQPRYLNITAVEAKTLTLSGAKTLNSLWLRGGNAMWYETVDGVEVLDNVIDHLDSGMIANGYTGGIIAYPDADVNFDGIISIQDLALVGGNYFLTSQDAYDAWQPVTTP